MRVERSGAERIFQRIGQEQASRIQAVDVALSTDAAHFVAWKRSGWLAPYVPEDAARHFLPDAIDADGMYATVCASLSGIGYNTNLVKSEDAPKSFADLLDPKWRGRIVKAHPAYSGTILTATFAMARELGWSYFEKLAQQRSCRCSRPATRRRSLRSANASCRPTAPTPSCCSSRNRVSRWKSSMRAKARR